MKKYIIKPCRGIKIDVSAGDNITIIDTEGGQVVDFFAQAEGRDDEFVSPTTTIDCNESFRLDVGDKIYSNKYAPMFEIIYDDVKQHDLFHPSCSREMFDFFYGNGDGHPNCLDNINSALGAAYPVIQPVNFFMNTQINADGSIEVKAPLSKAGDKIVLRALRDATLGIAACSVSESLCNSRKTSPIEVVIN